MFLNFRNKEYFLNTKNIILKSDSDKNNNIDWLIAGFDTETININDGVEGQCLTFSTPNQKIFKWLFKNGIEELLKILEMYNQNMHLYAHNLMFDWGILVKHHKDLMSLVRTGLCAKYVLWNGWVMKKCLFEGTSPFINLENNILNIKVCIKDTFSFLPKSLDKIGKMFGFEKMLRQDHLGSIDYRYTNYDLDCQYFMQYALLDSEITMMAGEWIRDLHVEGELKRIRVSSPSYSVGYMKNHSDGELKHCVDDERVMQLILNTYKGGRIGGNFVGYVNNVTVLDFVSSYPCSMTSLPSFDNVEFYSVKNISIEEGIEFLKNYHCFCVVDGFENDCLYPSLLEQKELLTPVFGSFKEVYSTGVEIYVGVMSGSLKISKIREMIIIKDDSNIKPFKDFILDNFSKKENAEKGSVEYLGAKLRMNSLYGKMIQTFDSFSLDRFIDDYIINYDVNHKKEFLESWYELYLDCLKEDRCFENEYNKLYQMIEKGGGKLEYKKLGDIKLGDMSFGDFCNIPAASIVTGISRARLLACMKVLKPIYYDTDSFFIRNWNKKIDLDLVNSWLPNYVEPVRIGNKLGDIDVELIGGEGYIAGIKKYWLKSENTIKRAYHGLPKLESNIVKRIIKNYSQMRKFEYYTKESPLKAKGCKDNMKVGKFVKRKICIDPKLDNRMIWEKRKDGYYGKYEKSNILEN